MLVPDLLNSGLAPCLSPGSGLRDLLTTRLHAPSLASSAIITPLPHLLYSSILACSHLYHTYFVQLLILILLLSLPSVFVIFNSPRCFHLVYFKMNRGEGQQNLTLFYDTQFISWQRVWWLLRKWSIHTWSHQPILPRYWKSFIWRVRLCC